MNSNRSIRFRLFKLYELLMFTHYLYRPLKVDLANLQLEVR